MVEGPIKTVYACAAVNQRKGCLSACSSTGLLVYSAHGRVMLYCPKFGCVIGMSNALTEGVITCLRVIPCISPTATTIVTAHANCAIAVWQCDAAQHWKAGEVKEMVLQKALIKDCHKGSISTVDAIYISPATLLIASAGADGQLTLSCVDVPTGTIQSTHQLPLKPLALDLKLLSTPYSSLPLILLGTDDCKVHIWRSEGESVCMYRSVAALPGHKDWVMALDCCVAVDSVPLIASGSKDGTVRVWRLQPPNAPQEAPPSPEDQWEDIKVEPVQLGGGGGEVVLQTVLAGHEGWVSGVRWCTTGAEEDKALRLVSSAQTCDRSIVVWRPQDEAVWLEEARFGEVGGNREGFFSAFLTNDTRELYAHSYQGGLHIWRQDDSVWCPVAAPTGHFRPVVDICWESERQNYLLSCSLDQTTRLHSAHKTDQQEDIWAEKCRPQTHGHDMSCIASIGLDSFVSGAEEKVLRGFVGPTKLLQALDEFCGWAEIERISRGQFVEAAAMPSLGLSNKRLKELNEEILSEDLALKLPLTEDALMAGSLWPEQAKMYGHGHELMCVAASAKFVASACKAANPRDAAINIWCAKSFSLLQSVEHHRLTVTQLAFSADGCKLLAVSRDRSWSVLALQPEGLFSVEFHSGLLGKEDHHSRVIWSGCWLPGTGCFVTGARDKTVVLWAPRGEGWGRGATFKQQDEVTAVAAERDGLLAVGMEGGKMNIIRCDVDTGDQISVEVIPLLHHGTVRRLAFRRNGEKVQLASCGDDNLICIHEIS